MNKVPVKIIVTGDLEKGRTHIGPAKSQMAILENQMRFQGLQQSSRTITPYPGVVYECWSCFSLQEIRIHVQPTGGKESVQVERQCKCWPCFTTGVIKKVYPEEYTDTWLRDGLFSYDIELCAKDRYIELQDTHIPSAGAEKYHEGQVVIVGVKRDPDYSEYAGESCMMKWVEEAEAWDDMTVLPIHCTDKMSKWTWQTETTGKS